MSNPNEDSHEPHSPQTLNRDSPSFTGNEESTAMAEHLGRGTQWTDGKRHSTRTGASRSGTPIQRIRVDSENESTHSTISERSSNELDGPDLRQRGTTASSDESLPPHPQPHSPPASLTPKWIEWDKWGSPASTSPIATKQTTRGK